MNARLESLALEKQVLIERSTLCRLRLRRDAYDLRHSLHWSRVAMALAPRLGRTALGTAFATVGLVRSARWAAIGGRVFLYVRLARAVFLYLRGHLKRA